MAKARMSVLNGDPGASISFLTAAKHIEDNTGYMEPPRFFQYSVSDFFQYSRLLPIDFFRYSVSDFFQYSRLLPLDFFQYSL